MHAHALIAIRAAQNATRWGIWAALRYVERNGVHPELFWTALKLEDGL